MCKDRPIYKERTCQLCVLRSTSLFIHRHYCFSGVCVQFGAWFCRSNGLVLLLLSSENTYISVFLLHCSSSAAFPSTAARSYCAAADDDLVELLVDGMTVRVPPGTTILQVC